MKRYYLHYDSNGFIKGVTREKRQGEGLTLSEVLSEVLAGALTLMGLWYILKMLPI